MPIAAPRLRMPQLGLPRVGDAQNVAPDRGVATIAALPVEERRASAAARGYGHKWQQARVGFLRKHPLCCCCAANDQIAAAEVVDHIVPHRGDMTLFWLRSNWQGLCRRCHDEIKKLIEHRWDVGEVGDAALRLDRPLPEFFG